MRSTIVALALAALASPLGPHVVSSADAASTWRCRNRLVSHGDNAQEVLRRCGDPDFRSFSTEIISFESVSGVVVSRVVAVEIWTYNRGPREFIRYLEFRDGRLADIIEGGYGY